MSPRREEFIVENISLIVIGHIPFPPVHKFPPALLVHHLFRHMNTIINPKRNVSSSNELLPVRVIYVHKKVILKYMGMFSESCKISTTNAPLYSTATTVIMSNTEKLH